MLSLFRLALGKIMLENPRTNPMNTSSYKKPKETWIRHAANYLALDIETLCFCNGSSCYTGKTDSEAIKLYQERTALAKLNNYENFFSNMGYVKFQSDFSDK